ncbi:MAG: hypothetical protein R3B72_17700 [Polyangiaceae bacterium]
MRRLRAGLLGVLVGAACAPPATPTAPTEARVIGGDVDAAQLLAPGVEAARDAGAVAFEPVGARVMVEGEQIGTFVEVPDDRCLLALARGGDSVRDVDLFVYDDSGDRLVSDEAPNDAAAVVLCRPPHPSRVYVAARLVTGDGMLALGIMTVARDRVDAVAQVLDAKGRHQSGTGKLDAWPGLEQAILERRRSLGGRWDDVRRLALPLEPRVEAAVSFRIDAGRCVDVFVAPSDDVQGIEVWAVDHTGQVVARARTPSRDRGLVLCSGSRFEGTLFVRPRHSTGLAAVVIAESPTGTDAILARFASLGVEAVGTSALLPLDQAIARLDQALSGLPAARPFGAPGHAGIAAPGVVDVTWPAGCNRIDVVAGEPMGRFVATIWDREGRRRAEALGGEVATLFLCGEAGKGRLEVRAEARPGPFAAFLRASATAPEALVARPQAAGRLSAWLEAVRGPVAADAAAEAKALTLSDGRLSFSLAVPAGSCREIALAGETAEGLTLVLREGETVAASLAGDHLVAERVCAEGEPRELAAELEAAQPGTALVLGRP